MTPNQQLPNDLLAELAKDPEYVRMMLEQSTNQEQGHNLDKQMQMADALRNKPQEASYGGLGGLFNGLAGATNSLVGNLRARDTAAAQAALLASERKTNVGMGDKIQAVANGGLFSLGGQ